MRRVSGLLIVVLASMAAPLAPVSAQESETEAGTAPSAEPQRPPVFSLPPGEVREAPQPDVQGPRAPGISAPRLLGQDSDPSPRAATANTPGPAVPTRQPDGAPAVVVSRPHSAPGGSRQSNMPVTRPATRESDADTSSVTETPRRPASIPAPVAEQAAAEPETSDRRPVDHGSIPWWGWLSAFLALVGIAAALRIFLSRHPAEDDAVLDYAPLAPWKEKPGAEPAVDPAPEPVTVAPGSATAVTSAAPPAADAPSRIEVDFQPLTARLSTLGLTLSYRLTLQNISDAPLRDVAVRLGMRCADDAAMEGAADADPPCVSLDVLEAGARHDHTAELRLDPQTYRPLQSHGKPMLVPIVDMFPSYRDSDDVVHEMHAAMLVGRELEPPKPKMQPFWLERGFGQFGTIGCRMLSVKTA